MEYLDYLDRSNIQEVRLLGGEPSLHPHFAKYIEIATHHDKDVFVFTNGLLPDPAVKALMGLPKNRCKILVNVSDSISNNRITIESRQFEVLYKLQKCAHIGFTIYNTNVSKLPLLITLIEETGCSRSIRLGLSHPTNQNNRYLHPKYYAFVGSKITEFIEKAAKKSIRVEFDCGFVRCMFTEEEIDRLNQCNINHSWQCSPIIDMDMEGSAIPCFPLIEVVRIEDAMTQTFKSLREQFIKNLEIYRISGIFQECNGCAMRIFENCSGGCLSTAIMRMKSDHFRYKIPSSQG